MHIKIGRKLKLKEVLRNSFISKDIYQIIKNNIINFWKKTTEENLQEKLRGCGIMVQVEETVVSHDSL